MRICRTLACVLALGGAARAENAPEVAPAAVTSAPATANVSQ